MSQFHVRSLGCSSPLVACNSGGESDGQGNLALLAASTSPTGTAVETLSPAPASTPSGMDTEVTSTSPTPSTTRTTPTETPPMESGPILEALPVTQMRLLTRLELRKTMADLLQVATCEAVLPEDTPIAELQLTMLQMTGLEIDNVSSWDNTRTTVQEIMG